MATPTKVRTDLELIISHIRGARERLIAAKAEVSAQEASLNTIPTLYAETLATIDSYTPDGAFEEYTKDLISQVTAEFLALASDAASAVSDLGNRMEF